jgi:hypothetical protein
MRRYYLARRNGETIRKDPFSRLQRTYGISEQDVRRMLDEQGGVCAICGGQQRNSRWRSTMLCVDHDHATGRVRGLLCNNCNTLLGSVKDRPEVLRAAADYLERYASGAASVS